MLIGLLLGLASSLHCVGMCAPLHLALPTTKNGSRNMMALHIGRIGTYIVLGSLVGALGLGAHLIGLGKWLSIISGLLILVIVFIEINQTSKGLIGRTNWIKKQFGRLFKNQSTLRFFGFGLANGLLPCGMVYVALVAAANTGSIEKSALFMTSYGLGTLPLLWTVKIIGQQLVNWLGKRFNQTKKSLLIVMGILLIFRGLELGIPYLSPSATTACHPQKTLLIEGQEITTCTKPLSSEFPADNSDGE